MSLKFRVLALVALACAAATARAADSPLPAELDLFPRDADLIVSVRVAKLWKSDLFTEFRNEVARCGIAVG